MSRQSSIPASAERIPDQQQKKVTTFFDSIAAEWDSMYSASDVYAQIHQDRLATALEWIEALPLGVGASVLDVGCGSGVASVALAKRGFYVHAADASASMLELTRSRAREAGVERQVVTVIGDANRLAYPDGTFSLVLALGVVPWLPEPILMLREIERVLAPGGYVIVNADNRWRLSNVLDPLQNPMLAPAKRAIGRALHAAKLVSRPLGARLHGAHTCRDFDDLLGSAGLRVCRRKTLGFGPFTFLNAPVLPQRLARFVHRRLQRLADAGVMPFNRSGAQYLVVASKTNRL